MPESRRVKLTKRLIKEAFIELLEEKPLAKVTVTDVCSIAEINRSTFYAYYEDVPSLMREIQEDVISRIPTPESLPDVINSLERFLDLMVPLFDYIQKNSKLFNVLVVQAECDDFAERIVRTVLERYPGFTYAQAVLETGRTHQIRVHMAYIGHPLLGDTVYGGGHTPFEKHNAALIDGQMLHATALILRHPVTGEEMRFETELPENFREMLDRLGRL